MTTNSSKVRRNVPPPSGSALANGAAATKASVYTRFIPREELNGFAAWEPGDFAGGAAAPPTPVARPPVVEAPPAPDPAAILAEHVQSARQAGYQDGYRDGLVALEGFKESFAHQATLQVGALLESIGAQLDALQQEMAQALTATATHLARQIVRSDFEQRPELIASVAQEALETLMLSARHITLRVHPDDHPLVAEGAGEALAARGARLIPDSQMTRGGCIVESNIGLIDASIETRWRRATAAVGRVETWGGAEAAPADPQGRA